MHDLKYFQKRKMIDNGLQKLKNDEMISNDQLVFQPADNPLSVNLICLISVTHQTDPSNKIQSGYL
jgi:hypothetical protein